MTDLSLEYNHPSSPSVLLWTDGPQIFFARDIIEGKRHLVMALEEYNVYAALHVPDSVQREHLIDKSTGSVSPVKLRTIFSGREIMVVTWDDETRIWTHGETRILDEHEIHGAKDVASLH